MPGPFLLAVMGPTSSGKSALAESLAERYEAQLINADAFQVYRGFDIGTGKPEDRSKYRLLDVADPSEQFGLGEWVRLASVELAKLYEQGRSAILVGGTGLYIRALMEEYSSLAAMPPEGVREALLQEERQFGSAALFERLQQLDPKSAERVDQANPLRVRRALEVALSPDQFIGFSLPPFRKAKIGIYLSSQENSERIRKRVSAMLAAGWVDEVRALMESGIHFGCAAMRALGYKELWRHVEGSVHIAEAEEAINAATRRYAKRQRAWLRSEPEIQMIEAGTAARNVKF